MAKLGRPTDALHKILLIALIAVGLGLRLRVFNQGLWSDELIAYADIHGRSLRGLLKVLSQGVENSPPLYFLFAWAGAKLGSDPALLRLPSLVAGTASIPLVYLLGVRTVGRWPGVIAAGFIALSPFAIHYSVEARPYALLLMISTLSALALLSALEHGGTARWAAWGLSLAAILYTHYTGAAVVLVEAAWAFWANPRARRDVALACGVGAAVFLPWIPFVKGDRLDVYGQIASALGINYPDAAVSWLVGLPFLGPGAVPGTPALVLCAAGLAVAIAARPWRTPPPPLVTALAIATPAAILLYSLLSFDLFLFPRNLTASLPSMALLIGWALARPGWPRAALPLALVIAGVGIGTVKAEQDRYARPDYPDVAAFIDHVAGPRDRVVYRGSAVAVFRMRDALRPYLDRRHLIGFGSDPHGWVESRRSRKLVVVTVSQIGAAPAPAARAARLREVADREYPGLSAMRVTVYRVE
ncbi:MAG TPA: glycosyltransferase family 39 protein [Thermoleophilaceae bacterium]|nr:glycosyltransferase family 39 protein [Thermoleophilaceae bacterium]